jgi:hypothetical protein
LGASNERLSLSLVTPGSLISELARSSITVKAFQPSMIRFGYVSENQPLDAFEAQAQSLIERIRHRADQ